MSKPPRRQCAKCPWREGNESHYVALRREWEEELGIHVGELLNEQPVWAAEFPTIIVPGRGPAFLIYYFIGKQFAGEPLSCEGQGFGWFRQEEMKYLQLAPGNQCAYDAIVHAAFGNGVWPAPGDKW